MEEEPAGDVLEPGLVIDEAHMYAWENSLYDAMSAKIEFGGITTRGVGSPVRELVLQGDSLEHCRLRITSQSDGSLRLEVVADRPDPFLAQAWREATEIATASVSQEPVTVSWRAAIGAPYLRRVDSLLVADRPYDVGGLHIAPGTAFDEEGWKRRFTAVQGVTSGASHVIVWRDAHHHLRQLCAMLTVAWSTAVAMRVPPTTATLPFEVLDEPTDGFTMPLPDWLATAWYRVEAEPDLRRALLVHHEGMLLRTSDHPSFALIAFVGAIEGLGLRWKPLDAPCPECGFKKGARRAFRAALERCAEPDAQKMLMRHYDRLRNPTVHEGHLHGGENDGGWLDPASALGMTAPQQFVLAELSLMQKASTALLTNVLSGATG